MQMISLSRDINGEKIFDVPKHGEMSQTTSLSMITVSEQASKVKQLEAKVALLEKQLELQKVLSAIAIYLYYIYTV